MRIVAAIFLLFMAMPSIAENDGVLDVYEQLEELRERIERLNYEVELRNDSSRRVYLMRVQLAEEEHTRLLHDYASTIVDQADTDALDLDSRLVELMKIEPVNIRAILRLNTRSISLPNGGETAAELALITTTLKSKLISIDAWYDALLSNLDLSRELGLDVIEEERELKKAVRKRAANVSFYPALALQDVHALRERAALLVDDKEIQSHYLVETDLVATIAGELETVAQGMNALDMDSSQYRSQLISATGWITSDLLTVDVFSNLVRDWTEVAST
jgi:hypothetical protein